MPIKKKSVKKVQARKTQTKDNNKQQNKKPPIGRFLAMSKLIGLIIAISIGIIVVYSMIEMHRLKDISSLPQLLISVFALGSVYVAFYLTLAKWEHTEEEKTEREKEVVILKHKLNEMNDKEELQNSIDTKESEISNLNDKLSEYENQDIQG